jgi:hypothetical protein
MQQLSGKRRVQIGQQIDAARMALDRGTLGASLHALDTAMKLLNGREPGGPHYDELNDALIQIGKAVYDAECDMTHYWRCEAWQTEDGKRRLGDPPPSDEKCSCGLKKIVDAINKAAPQD